MMKPYNKFFEKLLIWFYQFDNGNLLEQELKKNIKKMFDKKIVKLVDNISYENMPIKVRLILDACYKYNISQKSPDTILIALARILLEDDPNNIEEAKLILATITNISHSIRIIQRGHINLILLPLLNNLGQMPHQSFLKEFNVKNPDI